MQTTKKIICRRDPGVAANDFPADLHPVLARIYAARNVQGTEELDRSLERLHHPDLLKGIDTAIGLLATAIKADKHILIVADFDTDGATSCALAVRALTAMGAKHVSYVVPDRFRFGYGLTPEIVGIAAQRSPDLMEGVDGRLGRSLFLLGMLHFDRCLGYSDAGRYSTPLGFFRFGDLKPLAAPPCLDFDRGNAAFRVKTVNAPGGRCHPGRGGCTRNPE